MASYVVKIIKGTTSWILVVQYGEEIPIGTDTTVYSASIEANIQQAVQQKFSLYKGGQLLLRNALEQWKLALSDQTLEVIRFDFDQNLPLLHGSDVSSPIWF